MSELLDWLYSTAVAAISRGKVTRAQRGPRNMVQLQLLTGELVDRVEHISPYGMSALPSGGDAVMLTVGGTRDHKIVIAVDDPSKRIRDLGPGEFGFSDGNQQIVFRAGSLQVLTTKPITVRSDGDIVVYGANVAVHCSGTADVYATTTTLHGDLVVTGNISDQNGAHSTLAALRTAHNVHVHTQPADSHGDTEAATNATTSTV